ncbi:MAG: alpha/beta fold hydrolase [Bacillota bacterium]|nr:alpha/beta fold hydrolase [Bacillota bacterium]
MEATSEDGVRCTMELEPLFWRVHEPGSGGARTPLVLLLHGYGSNEEDLLALAPAWPGFRVVSARGPLELGPGAYAWFGLRGAALEVDPASFLRSLEQAEALVDELRARYGLDRRRLVVGGFSQGAMLAAALAFRRPAQVGALLMMSGRLPPEALVRPAAAGDSPRPLAGLEAMLTHGRDDPLIPPADAEAARDRLQALGAHVTLRLYAMGHQLNEQAAEAVSAWLRTLREMA